MELSIKDFGKIIKHTVKAYSGMFTATSTREIGRETKPTDTASTLIVMEQHTKEIGETIYSMEEE